MATKETVIQKAEDFLAELRSHIMGAIEAAIPSAASTAETVASDVAAAAPAVAAAVEAVAPIAAPVVAVAEPVVEAAAAEVEKAAEAAPDVITHKLQQGDNLLALAQQYLGDPNKWQQIAAENGISDLGSVQVGKTITITVPAKA